MSKPIVALISTRAGDREIMMQAESVLKEFGVSHEHICVRLTSVGREAALLQEKGARILIVGESSASAGVRAAAAATIPVLVVPLQSKKRPGAIPLMEAVGFDVAPVGILAIGAAGAKNAALSAIAILSLTDRVLARKYGKFRRDQTAKVLKTKVGKG